MIFSFEGQMGEGKTQNAVALIYTDAIQRNVKVIANIHLLPPFGDKIPFKYVDTKDFVEYMQDTDNQEMNDCDVLFDETFQLMEARRGQSKLVLLFSYYMLQTRKRRADLFCCFHHIKMVEQRLRFQIDWRGACRMRLEEPCTACGGQKVVPMGEKKVNEKKLAIYKQDGSLLPVLAMGQTSYHGHTTYKLKSLLDFDGKPFTADETQVFTKPLVSEDEWMNTFNFMLGEENGEMVRCERCCGYGKTGFSTVRFRDMKTGQPPKALRVFGPAVWPLYDTTEQIPLTKQQLRVKPEDL